MSFQDRLKQAQSDDFVGREKQLDLFRRNITADVPHYPLLQISGQGGVGKTTLLKRFQTLCDEQKVPYALTNEFEHTVPQAMHRLAELFAQAGHPLETFSERHQTYLQLQEKIEKDPDRPDVFSSLFSKAAGKSAVVVSRAVPLLGNIGVDLIGPDLIEGQVSALSSYLFQKLKNKDEVQLMLDPVAELSPLFVADLNQLAKNRQVVLMFDTFEDTDSMLLPWLLKLFEGRYGEFSEYISFVFAGRSFEAHDWLLVQSVLEHINLEPFTAEETQTYLAQHNLTDAADIDQIYHLSGGLPVYVAMLVVPGSGSVGEATRSVVERFLRNIEDPTRRQIALCLALTRRFDQDIMAVLLPSDTEAQIISELFTWLTAMPFVQSQRNGWRYHDVVRSQMITYQRDQSPTEFEQIHTTLAAFYTQWVDKYGGHGDDRWQHHTAWWAAYLEATYHGLCADPRQKLPQTEIELAEVIYNFNVRGDQTQQWSTALSQSATDLGAYEPLSHWARQVTVGLLVALGVLDENNVESLLNLFNILCQAVDGEKQPKLGAKMHLIRATSYFLQKDNERAIADFTEAIRLNPEDAIAYYIRGAAYRNLKDYEQAIADFTEAICLDPEYADAYYIRGTTYRNLKDYEQAITDFSETIRLNPEYADAYNSRGISYAIQGEYERANADFSESIRFKPEDTAYYYRGMSYDELKEYERAIADYSEAIRLNPEYADAYNNRGIAYRNLKEYEQAIADYSEAIRLNPEYAIYYNRGHVYRELKEYEQAIADYSEAIRLNPEHAKAYNNRGLSYAELKEYEQAIADFTEAIRLNPEYTYTYNNRGLSYVELKEYEQAIADYNEVIRLNPEYASAYYNMACAYALQHKVEDVLSPLQRTLELNPAYYLALIPDDSDFDAVRDDPRFQVLLSEFLE